MLEIKNNDDLKTLAESLLSSDIFIEFKILGKVVNIIISSDNLLIAANESMKIFYDKQLEKDISVNKLINELTKIKFRKDLK